MTAPHCARRLRASHAIISRPSGSAALRSAVASRRCAVRFAWRHPEAPPGTPRVLAAGGPQDAGESARALAEEELKTLRRCRRVITSQLVAKEPLVDRSDRHRLRCRRPDVGARDARLHAGARTARTRASRSTTWPCSKITNGDGVMDKRTVFADKLVLPRAIKVLDARRARRRAAEPVADEGHQRRPEGRHEGPRQQYLRPRRSQHRAQREQPVLGTRQHHLHVRARLAPAVARTANSRPCRRSSRGQWGALEDDAGRIYRNVNDAPLFVDFIAARYYMRNPNLVRTRGLYDPLISREASVDLAGAGDARRQSRLPRSVLPPRRQLADASRASARPSSTAAIACRRSCYGDAFITDSTDQPRPPLQARRRRHRPAEGGRRLRQGGDPRVVGRALPAGEPARPRPTVRSTSSTCIAASCRRRFTGRTILRDYIKARDLEQPVNLGRIWRIVHDTTKRDQAPALSKATPRRRS